MFGGQGCYSEIFLIMQTPAVTQDLRFFYEKKTGNKDKVTEDIIPVLNNCFPNQQGKTRSQKTFSYVLNNCFPVQQTNVRIKDNVNPE